MKFEVDPKLVVIPTGIFYDMKIKIVPTDFILAGEINKVSWEFIDQYGNTVSVKLIYDCPDIGLLKNLSNNSIQIKKWNNYWTLSTKPLISKIKNLKQTNYDNLHNLYCELIGWIGIFNYKISIRILKDNFIQPDWLATQKGLTKCLTKLSVNPSENVNFTVNNVERPFQGGKVNPR